MTALSDEQLQRFLAKSLITIEALINAVEQNLNENRSVVGHQDQQLVSEARELIGDIESVAVKLRIDARRS